ncbi:pleckstrin homology domain-containing family M member 1 [Tachyglossus aculeatus]|uniref:pleckstrin homology domain-containing family M member 1 n=1 Tax=Tachyglossus aculeatus TaxID=9261 RepID=UPI0018F2C63F|nr:pleckstrin homology domain-containing family M member 1 [Tachyglossus aculeatus]
MLSALDNGQDPLAAITVIKRTLVNSVKALQRHFVASDTVVTSEDGDANTLCSALEAVFIHGLKAKHIKAETGGKKAGGRGPLPCPVFWPLLKAVTHRNTVADVEGLPFITSDVGRCRAWVRLALNDGLVGCHLQLLLRERALLAEHYLRTALLLDPEEAEFLLSFLQGLTSLTFDLSYKSAVLNEWTLTPLALSGLCQFSEPDPGSGAGHGPESSDSGSVSSGSDDVEVQRCGLPGGRARSKQKLTASSLSLDTTGSSQLSCSPNLASGLSQDRTTRSTDRSDEAMACDWDTGPVPDHDSDRSLQDLLRSIGLVAEEQGPGNQPKQKSGVSLGLQSAELPSQACAAPPPRRSPSVPPQVLTEFSKAQVNGTSAHGPSPLVGTPPLPQEPLFPCTPGTTAHLRFDGPADHTADATEGNRTPPLVVPVEEEGVASQEEDEDSRGAESTPPPAACPKSRSWISEEDFYRPTPARGPDPGSDFHTLFPAAAAKVVESAPVQPAPGNLSKSSHPGAGKRADPSPLDVRALRERGNFRVIHRRQIGLSNPFRGLLKLGTLERRGPMGLWKELHCELSPTELRFFASHEDRTCVDSCSLLRCESLGRVHRDGRFELVFAGKKLALRAPSRGEAEDWLDRLREVLPQSRTPSEDEWETLEDPDPRVSPRADSASDWTSPLAPEPDALKEAIVRVAEGEAWTPQLLSLSPEMLRCFRLCGGGPGSGPAVKELSCSHSVGALRDVLPDPGLGGPACFRIVTPTATLKVRAQSAREAAHWRQLLRHALACALDAAGAAEAAEGLGPDGPETGQWAARKGGFLPQDLLVLPVEKGLDAQNFICAGCAQPIGFSFVRPKLCAFSGLYYCDACHRDDDSVIPARVIHNWDLSRRAVCRQALRFLEQVRDQPLINLQQVNASLYEHVERMGGIWRSREQLKLLGEYLTLCRSGAGKELSQRVGHRQYLLESPHRYSVADLRQIADGVFEGFLQAGIQFASHHVYHCDLCTQRGFICQICNRDDIIFPFELDTTTRCQECRTVFHRSCQAGAPDCPRCARRRKYQEQSLHA